MGNCCKGNHIVNIKNKKYIKNEKKIGKDRIHKILFFPDPSLPCMNHFSNIKNGCNKKNCKKSHKNTNLLYILNYIKQAKKSLFICVYTITCDQISDEIINAFNRGVQIRIITDDNQSKGLGSDIQKFYDFKIPIRHDNARTNMHHKFCIIDSNILINGSFNWSRQAVLGNQENVVISSGISTLIFTQYFEQLWISFSDNTFKNMKKNKNRNIKKNNK